MFKKVFGRGLPITNSTLQQCFDPYISEIFFGRALPITNSTLQQRFGDIHVRKKYSAEVFQLPIQHFNSVLEPYMSKKIFGRALPICNSTLQQVFDLYISYCQSSARVPITNSTLQQRFGAIYVHKILRQSSADFQFNTSTVF